MTRNHRQSPLPWSCWLSLIRQVEVLVQLGANNMEKRTQRSKFGPLAGLEALKAMLQLIILCRAGGRTLIDGAPTPWRPQPRPAALLWSSSKQELSTAPSPASVTSTVCPLRPSSGLPPPAHMLSRFPPPMVQSFPLYNPSIVAVVDAVIYTSLDALFSVVPLSLPALGSETRASSLPDSEGSVASSQPTPKASAPASPIPGSQPLLPEAPPEQDRHSSEKASSSGPGVTVSTGTGPSTEWPSRPRFDRNRPTILPGMLPEDSAVEPEAEGKLTDRLNGSGSLEVYWWSPPGKERRPSEPDFSAEPAEGDETSKPLDQSRTVAAIQREGRQKQQHWRAGELICGGWRHAWKPGSGWAWIC
ncbi:hypothetical protein WJX74_011114 [Apatococcus lobatus]|uniref:Uncharacterized protein n=1 Tax=Apatococcus lobatus TaxID=904363 RepID=A0AAW1SCI5_9CHLO